MLQKTCVAPHPPAPVLPLELRVLRKQVKIMPCSSPYSLDASSAEVHLCWFSSFLACFELRYSACARRNPHGSLVRRYEAIRAEKGPKAFEVLYVPWGDTDAASEATQRSALTFPFLPGGAVTAKARASMHLLSTLMYAAVVGLG
jgi:hypothetical protein